MGMKCLRWLGILLLLSAPALAAEQLFDVVIRNGRVIDPETRLDAPARNVGIRGKTIVAITAEPLHGQAEIDAAGRVVAPGFIDVLSYNPAPYGAWYKLADGVTTNLAMHGAPGTGGDMKAWYRIYERQRPPVHFGGAFLYGAARSKLNVGTYRPASAAQLAILTARAEQALQDGALGISMSLEYVPGISQDEVEAMMRLAQRNHVPVFFHVRYSSMEPPGTNLDALREVLSLARRTGAAVQIEHINSTGGTHSMAESLRLLEAARKEGVDVTADAYPYPYWGSPLDSARFAPGWQKRFRIGYGDLQLAGSAERLTPASFARYRRQHKLAIAYAIPEEDVVTALRSPFVMLGSDAILEPGNNNHPRAAGTFTRTLRVYVREQHVLTLMEALEKMTILPARRLEAAAPALRRKGRLQVGADADLVVFDPETITDRATYDEPTLTSAGIAHVFVSGTAVVRDGELLVEARPGRPVRGSGC